MILLVLPFFAGGPSSGLAPFFRRGASSPLLAPGEQGRAFVLVGTGCSSRAGSLCSLGSSSSADFSGLLRSPVGLGLKSGGLDMWFACASRSPSLLLACVWS